MPEGRVGRSTSRLALALALALLTVAFGGSRTSAAATDLLPDLQLATPYNLYIQTTSAGRKLLHFGALVWNVGDGPIEIRARDRVGGHMTTIVQRIRKSNGRAHSVPQPLASAVYSGDGHDHWHLQDFIGVSVYPAPEPGTVPVPSETDRVLRKIGFCLVDLVRAPADLRPPNSVLRRSFRVAGCGNRNSVSVRVGISVGYGDDYKPFFVQQWIDVSHLPAGVYQLCASVNPDLLWRERADNFANNTVWMNLDLNNDAGTVSVIESVANACNQPLSPPPPPPPPPTPTPSPTPTPPGP